MRVFIKMISDIVD